jgi:hypothetical protein
MENKKEVVIMMKSRVQMNIKADAVTTALLSDRLLLK